MLEAHDLAAGFDGRTLFDGVTFALESGRIMGLCGASGAGKTTLGRVIAGLHRPSAGVVRIDGQQPASGKAQPVQYLHQSPLAAMNPRWKIRCILAEAGQPEAGLLTAFGVDAEWMGRFPHELSGGQLQRISILRALTANPRYLIADEITAPLDPVSQARIWHLLGQIARSKQIGILAISHDRALLDRICCQGRFELGQRGLIRHEAAGPVGVIDPDPAGRSARSAGRTAVRC
ncbi:ABC transporter ATP-binding protein [Paracoccus aestuariivivens]|uniref:ATP-binding cassette domain-containing protein n=1 Tax=Paracoccus aestuariivivens TaxID=1820333 RepID=A0A6L6JB11_9RHOB|nr:ATP-binding cassette domain-containing protein [Paracoccus aestuariivivens]MTH78385.1 ATP-binding cassette domain-containing protein [Paracoccus aestuariivivens]